MSSNAMWKHWITDKPEAGRKIVVVCDDGFSCRTGRVSKTGKFFDAEDGELVGTWFLEYAIWAYLPDDYKLAFEDSV